MTKSFLRSQNLKFRTAFSSNATYTKSKKVFGNLTNSGVLQKTKRIHIYKSKSDEIDTSEIISWCLINNLEVFVPSIDFDNEIKTLKINQSTVFGRDKFGVSVPISNFEMTDESDFDLIVIPIVGFDSLGNRVGYGKGCYDKFLNKNTGLRIGLAFEWQKSLENIEVEEFDQSLDGVVSEIGFYKFG